VFLAIAGVAGCSGERDALQKRVTALQEEVTLLQNSQDRLEERLAALELRESQMAERSAQAAPSTPPTVERPRLKVIKVDPDSAAAPAPQGTSVPPAPQPEGEGSDSPRPVIRGTGTRLESRMPPGSTSRFEPLHSTPPPRDATADPAGRPSAPRRPLGA
jgi:hypothetical protein